MESDRTPPASYNTPRTTFELKLGVTHRTRDAENPSLYMTLPPSFHMDRVNAPLLRIFDSIKRVQTSPVIKPTRIMSHSTCRSFKTLETRSNPSLARHLMCRICVCVHVCGGRHMMYRNNSSSSDYHKCDILMQPASLHDAAHSISILCEVPAHYYY